MAQGIIHFPFGRAPIFSDEVGTSHETQSDEPRRALEIRCAELESKLVQLRRLASIDDLTGLANRRYFDRALKKEIRRACRTRLPLALIICDVDHFKRYNDKFGHQRGDAALQLLGAVLSSSIRRAGDVAARYGGEEFAVLLPGTGPMNALHFAERLRSLVGKLQLLSGSRREPEVISMSLGVTTLHATSPCAPGDVVSAADAALYEAKGSGRNRVRYRAM